MADRPASRRAALPPAVRIALQALDDRKAQQIVALDLRGLSDATDYFVIGSGTSDAHVRGLADLVVERLSAEHTRPHHVEGLPAGRWALLDFVDFVVHVFHPETRAFYQLERLWSDAPRVMLPAVPERAAPERKV